MVWGKGFVCSQITENFAYGKMIPQGNQMPAGGRPGDTYAFYFDEQADTPDVEKKLQTLFDHAKVCLFCLRDFTLILIFPGCCCIA